ncbi:hypothetical protein [Bradyrhizobium arachidis]|uniref:hypothetical protein n=1 Tax=Bradyrhizobium arachidis TaxID=858423 RepID=UPI00142DC0A7|nr:hypothetical protein [Bradyrhizobium arachidis]
MPAVVWNIGSPLFAATAMTGGSLGWLIVLYSTFLISHFELFGLTQVITRFAGRRAGFLSEQFDGGLDIFATLDCAIPNVC